MGNSKNEVSKATREFSRFAHSYGEYNTIQTEVAKTLVSMLPYTTLHTVLDLGCGRGAIYRELDARGLHPDRFIALDASSQMLDLHPSHKTIEKVCMDFNMPSALSIPHESIILSSSALQWVSEPESTFSWLSSLGEEAYFAIFTSNTFQTLHTCAGVTSPIYSSRLLKEIIDRYYDASYVLRQYELEFSSVQDMFSYIKKSGVSGGERRLGYKETKALMKAYPLNYLEFEVLFVKAKPHSFS